MKKIIIISISVFTIAILVILLLLNRSAKKQTVQNAGTSSPSPSAATLPQLPNTKAANINQSDVTGSVKENISQLEASNQPASEIQFKEGQNQTPSATLHEFEASTGIKISPEVYNGLSQNEYSLFSCKGESGNASGLGLIMLFKQGTTAAYFSNLYSQMDKWLKTWESSIFSDLSSFLFSGKKFSKSPIFKSTKYTTENGVVTIDVRYGEIKSDDGSDLSIYYAVYNEDVYIFNDSKCLGKALDKYQPALEP